MERMIIRLDLMNVEGVGPTTREMLINAGYDRITDLIDCEADVLAKSIKVGNSTAQSIINNAKEIVIAIAKGEFEVRV
jgi:hypothetical protein